MSSRAIRAKPHGRPPTVSSALVGFSFIAPVTQIMLTVAPQTVHAAEAPVIEEIVVTARRREENLLDVPASVSAFSTAQLEQRGTQDIIELSQLVPNVTLEVSRSSNTTLTPFIRGIGQQDPIAGFEQGVGIYIDDIYLNRPQGAVLQVYEVDRVEVLRGPQGTLYGRNTIGGAIKYVTRRIGDQPGTRVTLRGGTYGQADVVTSVDLPLTSTLRVGGTVASFQRDGFGDNLTLGGRQNYNKDILAARAAVEWEPTPTLFVRLTGDYSDDESDPRQGHRQTVGNDSGAPILDDVFDTRAGLDGPTELETHGVALSAEWSATDRIVLKWISSFRDDDTISQNDFDSLPAPDLDVPSVIQNEQFSQELQFQYAGDRLRGVVGAFFMNATAFNKFDLILGTTVIPGAFPDGITSFSSGDFGTKTWSIFSDFSYSLVESLEVSLGGRFTDDQRDGRILLQTYSGQGSPNMGGTGTLAATSTDFDGEESFSEFTPRVSLTWKPTPLHSLYASYSAGFKGGSFDPRGDASQTPDYNGNGEIEYDEIKEFLLFEPETVDSFELGSKGRYFGGRVSANVALFYSDYTDIQVPGSVGVDGDGDGIYESFRGVTTNAGKAEIKGLEIEAQAALTDRWRLMAGIGYIDAQFKEFVVDQVNVAGQRVFQKTPEWTANLTTEYAVPLTMLGRGGLLSLSTSVSYRDETSQFDEPNPLLDQEAFTLVNAGLTWVRDDGVVSVGIHGKNLSDEKYKVAGFNIPTLGREGSVTSYFGDPRTFAITVGLSL